MAFGDEIIKISGLGGFFKSPASKGTSSAFRTAKYFFSPKAGADKWDKFLRAVKNPDFVNALTSNPLADTDLITHTNSMHDLANGKTVGLVESSRLNGQKYEVRETSFGLACTCPDWRFHGSLDHSYRCKHILAYLAGKRRAED
jgi:hypothetical protein